MPKDKHWVGTWATAPAPAEGAAFSNQTLRMNARVSIGGDTLRVRLSNAYGTRPLTIGAAHIGLRATGAGIVPGSDRALTFGGETSATIAAGALLLSDPVELSRGAAGGSRDHASGCRTTCRRASASPVAMRARPTTSRRRATSPPRR